MTPPRAPRSSLGRELWAASWDDGRPSGCETRIGSEASMEDVDPCGRSDWCNARSRRLVLPQPRQPPSSWQTTSSGPVVSARKFFCSVHAVLRKPV